MAQDRERLIRAQLEMVMAQHDIAMTNALIGVQGMQGPKGLSGVRGDDGMKSREKYTLSYCGVHFLVELLPETFAMIEDATNLNGDELNFIKVINEDEWKRIRDAWSWKWHEKKAYAAFERGEYFE